MYKYLLVFVLSGCSLSFSYSNAPPCNGEPKFHYNDLVTITSGFYKGAIGEVVSLTKMFKVRNCYEHAYNVELSNNTILVNENLLDKRK